MVDSGEDQQQIAIAALTAERDELRERLEALHFRLAEAELMLKILGEPGYVDEMQRHLNEAGAMLPADIFAEHMLADGGPNLPNAMKALLTRLAESEAKVQSLWNSGLRAEEIIRDLDAQLARLLAQLLESKLDFTEAKP